MMKKNIAQDENLYKIGLQSWMSHRLRNILLYAGAYNKGILSIFLCYILLCIIWYICIYIIYNTDTEHQYVDIPVKIAPKSVHCVKTGQQVIMLRSNLNPKLVFYNTLSGSLYYLQQKEDVSGMYGIHRENVDVI